MIWDVFKNPNLTDAEFAHYLSILPDAPLIKAFRRNLFNAYHEGYSDGEADASEDMLDDNEPDNSCPQCGYEP